MPTKTKKLDKTCASFLWEKMGLEILPKLQWGQFHYQLPDGIILFWNNIFEVRNSEIPWNWCGGHSNISSNTFDLNLGISQEDFDKNITFDPKTVDWLKNNVWSGFDSDIKFAVGLIRGYYEGIYNNYGSSFCEEMRGTGPKRLDWSPYSRFWSDEHGRWTGLNGEVAQADQYAVFYRNGTWPNHVIIGKKPAF